LLPPIPETDAVRQDPQSTRVRVLWDPQYLYVSFDCRSNNVFFSGTKSHDDMLFKEDAVEVFIDGFGDGRQYIEVQVNPAGVNFDAMHVVIAPPETTHGERFSQAFCDSGNWLSFPEWTMKGLRTAARRTHTGWTAELAIPADTIMKRKGSAVFFPTGLRANFVRCDHPASGPNGKRELTPQNWSPVLFGCPHISPTRMGRLQLISNTTGTIVPSKSLTQQRQTHDANH
jgi:hypothetical protein